MSGLRLVARWYLRAARILLARAVWRFKHRRALRAASAPVARAIGKITAETSVAIKSVGATFTSYAPKRAAAFSPYKFCRLCGEPRDGYGGLSHPSGGGPACAECGVPKFRDAWNEFAAYDPQAHLWSGR